MITLDLELKDIPGELIKALMPISKLGANIISVIHLREQKSNGRVPVKVVVDNVDNEKLKKIVDELEKHDVIVAKIGNDERKINLDVVVIGHVVDTDVRNTIDRINEIGLVVDLDLVMPDPFKESSARMRIVIDKEKLEELYNLLDKISKEKDLLFIKSC
ncbi:hypothetical protein [Methanotorris formicicus]|uniref:Amino acid-binding ACT domain protein n=1 Tax=Methanotorris formicicus Mc-S-70 TaxID=647171 RepID=H1KZR9_9EURY|nr:hypothetical protein [Methanotorris formicicus]EHP85616.1 amino acid-binding ACT domain protein [Methanotorris formicicus Mc-S-70]